MNLEYQQATKFKKSGNYNQYFKILIPLANKEHKNAISSLENAWSEELDLKQTYTPELLVFYENMKNDYPKSYALYHWMTILYLKDLQHKERK